MLFHSGRLLLSLLWQHRWGGSWQHWVGRADFRHHWGLFWFIFFFFLVLRSLTALVWNTSSHFSGSHRSRSIKKGRLAIKKIQVVVVGLATDYCVGSTALHSIKEVGWILNLISISLFTNKKFCDFFPPRDIRQACLKTWQSRLLLKPVQPCWQGEHQHHPGHPYHPYHPRHPSYPSYPSYLSHPSYHHF